jgi:hypothetical protein
VHIDVPVGELLIGHMLVQCMYTRGAELPSSDQGALLRLLQLADKYQVSAAVAAVSSALLSLSMEQLQWETVPAVYTLPKAFAEHEAIRGVYQAAANKLQHELGDLELVFADPQGQIQQLFLALPYAAVLQLLQDERTRVTHEDTAAYALVQWLSMHGGKVSNEEMVQLVSRTPKLA